MPADPVIPRTNPLAQSQLSKWGNLASAPLQGTVSAQASIDRVKYTHDAMIDLIIANPAITQNAIAKTFGYTPAWVSRVFNSDAFQARLAVRKADIVDPSLTLSIEEKLKALVDNSLDILMEKLATVKSPDLAMEALKIGSKALGFGARPAAVAPITQNTFVVAMPAQIKDQNEWANKHGGNEAAIDVSSRTLDERLAEAEAKQKAA